MNWKSLLGTLKYAPIIMNAVKQVRHRNAPPATPPENDNKEITNILTKLVRVNEELTEKMANLKERHVQLEQDFNALKLIVWIGGGGICVLTLIMVIVTLMALANR